MSIEPAFEAAEEKWPRVEVARDGGGVRISGRYKPAAMGQRVAGYPMLALLLLWLASCVASGATDNPALSHTLATASALAFLAMIVVGIVLLLVGNMLRPNLDIRFTRDVLSVKSPFGRVKNYRVGDIREFAFDEHQKAKEIRRRTEARTGQGRVDKDYRGTREAVMRYGRRRVPIASFRVQDFEKGAALVRVLQDALATVTGTRDPNASDRSGTIDVETDLR